MTEIEKLQKRVHTLEVGLFTIMGAMGLVKSKRDFDKKLKKFENYNGESANEIK